MMRSSSSLSSSYGFVLVVVLLVTATGMAIATATKSQFCDECTPEIFDITIPLLKKGIPTWKNKDDNVTRFPINETGISTPDPKLLFGTFYAGTHWGTHVDSLGHLKKYEGRYDVLADSLNLNTLMGPVLVVEAPRESNLTSIVLKSLQLPKDLKRVIFKTANTYNKLAEDTATFYFNYTGFTADGAKWLVDNTNITFVGIDYMSVAISPNDDVVAVHTAFLEKSIIPVEFLKLDGIEPGYYTVYCLPLKVNADGSPVRCILVR